MVVSGWGYALVFAGSLLLSLVATPLALRFALRRSLLDLPGERKGHSSPVPYLGGAAIVVSFAVAVGAATLLRRPAGGRAELLSILVLAVALALVGLVDDLRPLSAWLRLAAQTGAAGGLLWAGLQVRLTDVPVVDGLITVVWVVGITNAFNLLDNMDGLSAGVAAIAAGSFFVLAAVNGQFLVAGLSIGLAGCALGFLRHNFHPARIYMGDAGSHFLGFVLAALGIKLRFDAPRDVTFLVPVLVLGVAVFDTTLVTACRLVHGRSPIVGGQDHTSHRLVLVGCPVPAAVALIYGAGIGLGWLALVVARIDAVSAWLLAGLVLVVGAFTGTLLAQVPVYEGSTRRHLVLQVPDGRGPATTDVGPPPDLAPSRSRRSRAV